MEVAESLNIHLDNLDFSDMYPEVKEDTPDVEKDKLTSSGMNPKERGDNVTDVEVKEDNIYFSEMCQVVQRIDSEAKRVPSITSSSGGIHTNESVVEEIKQHSGWWRGCRRCYYRDSIARPSPPAAQGEVGILLSFLL